MKYSLGLDIGVASVGWAVINEDKKRIEDCGVRIFEKAENPKNGTSLALPRRTARSARRRLKRRRQRLDYLKAFFVKKGWLAEERIDEILDPSREPRIDPYDVRRRALAEKLSYEEMFVALYHIAKRRGYKSNRKSVEEKDPEGSKVLSAISENGKLFEKHKTKSIAEIVGRDEKFEKHIRNKADDYTNSFVRESYLAEIQEILDRQKEFGADVTEGDIDELLNKKNRGLFYQRPFMTAELIEQMRGNCTFEAGEPRGQKASYSFEMFRLAQDLAHLEIMVDGKTLRLTAEEMGKCIEKAKTTKKVTYKAVRDVLGYKNDDSMSFGYVRGPQTKRIADPNDPKRKINDPKFDPESNTFCEMKFYHGVKSALKELPEDWTVVEGDVDLFDEIGYILTTNKDDEAIRSKLGELGRLSDAAIEQLMLLNCSGFGHVSIKAMRKLTEKLVSGEAREYDKAVELVFPGKFAQKLSGDRYKLPPLTEDEGHQITNPVVKRAVSQVNKVVNAVIDKYGEPWQIKLETANDLRKSFDERKKIKQGQDENAENNEKIRTRLVEEFGVAMPTGTQITKFKLYMNQQGKCLYSGETIDLGRLFSDEMYCEIDHIIPRSRCGVDSKVNFALVLNAQNQEKMDRTPFEAWGGDTERWEKFQELVKGIYPDERHPKRMRLLAEKVPENDWQQHALNDTRYINKFLAQRMRKNLRFADDAERKQKVLTPAGRVTAELRRIYGIGKSRVENNLHHAADACVVATVSQGTISDYAKWSRAVECDSRLRPERPEPWEDFGKEVRLRTSELKAGESLADYRDKFRDLYKDQDENFRDRVHPIFVSRMPKRAANGQMNKETVRSPKVDENGRRTIRKRLRDLKLKDLDDSVLVESDKVLYQQLRELLEQAGDDPKKAFAEPVYKNGKSVDKNGRPLMPVSTVKIYTVDPDSSGFYINDSKGFVNNGSMVRVDVYSKKNKKDKLEHFFVPVYTYQVKKGSTKILPAPKGFTDVDESFEMVCSFYPNDYVRFDFGEGRVEEGYYSGYNIRNGTVKILSHTSANKNSGGKGGLFEISARFAQVAKKMDISILGDNYRWE